MDPARSRDAQIAIENPARAQGRDEINRWICDRIEIGQITDRPTMVAQLAEVGFAVPRAGQNYLTIQDPETAERWRMKGTIYDANWTRADALERAIAPEAGGYDARTGRLDQISAGELRQRYNDHIERRADYNRGRYPKWLESVRSALRKIHQKLEAHTQWPIVNVVGVNSGTRPATEVLLRIGAGGKLLNRNNAEEHKRDDGKLAHEDSLELPLPPNPPRGKMVASGLYQYADMLGGCQSAPPQSKAWFKPRATPIYRDPDQFYWRSGENDWVNVMELDCLSWRHGQDPISYAYRHRLAVAAPIWKTVGLHPLSATFAAFPCCWRR